MTRRYAAEEYKILSNDILAKLGMLQDICRCDIIEACRNKESFGDLDIIYSTYDDKPLTVDVISKHFRPNEIVSNGIVISFDQKEFQIDIIHSTNETYNYGLSYYNFQDAGNLIGKLTRQLGLKHGHDGLFLPLWDGDNMFDEILLTTDHDETLKLVGLEPSVFEGGFDDLVDVFDYVASSQYYNPENYLLENISSVGRIRDRKRDTYRKFLEYGKTWVGTPFQKVKDKTIFLEHIFDTFPKLYHQYSDAMKNIAFKKLVSKKFNGDIVSELTGLTGKELGRFMVVLRSDWNFRPENIVYFSDEKIKSVILEKHRKFAVQ